MTDQQHRHATSTDTTTTLDAGAPADDLTSTAGLTNATLVFTGTFSTLTHAQAAELVDRYGATTTDAPTEETDYIVVGDNPADEHLAAADTHDIPTIRDVNFFSLFDDEVLGQFDDAGNAQVEVTRVDDTAADTADATDDETAGDASTSDASESPSPDQQSDSSDAITELPDDSVSESKYTLDTVVAHAAYLAVRDESTEYDSLEELVNWAVLDKCKDALDGADIPLDDTPDNRSASISFRLRPKLQRTIEAVVDSADVDLDNQGKEAAFIEAALRAKLGLKSDGETEVAVTFPADLVNVLESLVIESDAHDSVDDFVQTLVERELEKLGLGNSLSS